MRTGILLGLLLFGACGRGGCPGGDRVERLRSQFNGGCCEFSTAGGACRANEGWVRNEGRECVRWAAECLGQLGPAAASAVPDLVQAVGTGPNNYDTGDGVIPVRDSIVIALGQAGGEQALPVLLEALANPRPVEAGPGAVGFASAEPVGEEAALTALRHLGGAAKPALPAIRKLLERPQRTAMDERVVRAAQAAIRAIESSAY